MNLDLYARAESAAAFVLSQTALRPRIGLVLGSGLGSFADDLTEAARIPYAHIPTFPRSTAVGHVCQLLAGQSVDLPLSRIQGPAHPSALHFAAQTSVPPRRLS